MERPTRIRYIFSGNASDLPLGGQTFLMSYGWHVEADLAKNYMISYYIVFIGKQVPSMGYYMQNAPKLDKVFCCRRCASVFLFESDVEDHAEMCGHRSIMEIDL